MKEKVKMQNLHYSDIYESINCNSQPYLHKLSAKARVSAESKLGSRGFCLKQKNQNQQFVKGIGSMPAVIKNQ